MVIVKIKKLLKVKYLILEYGMTIEKRHWKKRVFFVRFKIQGRYLEAA